MTEPSPEIVAAASLSPLSPRPIPLHSTTATLVPKLQDHVAAAEVSLHDSLSSRLVPEAAATMASTSDAAEPSDTIVVAGDYSDDESLEESDFDAYGEDDDDEQEQEQNQPDSVIDDYAKTFDSPSEPEQQGEAGEAQPDVSMVEESMNSSSAPATLKSESPPATTSVLPSPPAPEAAITNGLAAPDSSAPSDRGLSEAPSADLSAVSKSTASPSIAAAAAASESMTDAVAPSAPTVPSATSTPTSPDDDGGSIDIVQLVKDITAGAASSTTSAPSAQATPVTSQSVSNTTSTLSPSASLPPKPLVSHHQQNHLPAFPQAHSFPARNPNSLPSVTPLTNTGTASRGQYSSTGAPGTAHDGFSSLPPPPQSGYGVTHAQPLSSPSTTHYAPPHSPAGYQGWDAFLVDEKRYVDEAKWERFPEGSRIFMGNLSADKVTKREVFDIFSRFGRLAQISLKNVYGFVQYHTVAEGQAAMQGAQGIELGGRKIHLEISRNKKKENRQRSPERRMPPRERGGRPNDRFDNRESGWRRDDHRHRRSPSPPRHDRRASRDGFGPRDRDFGSFDRRRSRSPPRHGRSGPESYRARSPSPRRRAPSDVGVDIPRRYGSDVPDVQLVLLQEVSRDFVAFVERAFKDRGLKTDVMFFNPRFPRDALVQRQVLEGVHGIVDLDFRAEAQRRINIQLFRRPVNSEVQFELYDSIDPPTAAALVLREKSQSAQPAPSYPPQGYGRPYYPEPAPAAAPASAPVNGYAYHYSQPSAPQPQPQPAAHAPNIPNIATLDNAALQTLLASLNPQQGQAGLHGHQTGISLTGGAPVSSIDLHAMLGNLGTVAAAQPAPAHGYPAASAYGAAPAYLGPGIAGMPSTTTPVGVGFGGADTAQQVQTIMEQLRRATQ
ncbi:putative splicing factor, arginine/serine-rich 6 [Echria macrotheca]|uniref:Splicing factor, arginine/serine-rich 6 n=1 Tax=Echria macrotheca TaxID=438768 RepID=A0AAJ0FDL1_9PEZI|nr:putative splicing factor, arginine/serine-rich 6 [Echria macrotheca]